MVVGGSQQETLDLGFVLLGTRQQGVPVILRELVLPGGFDLVFNSQLQLDVPDHDGLTNEDDTGIQCLTTLLPVTPSNMLCSHREKSKDRVEEIGRVYLAITNISGISDLIWLVIAVHVEHSVTARVLVQMHDREPPAR
ncbi:unnamed protein product [Schistosoma margrebowiei]|uniref:Uncharacterized protein n=1 Tax=Schistosoma margrebowiei TaxID=48269 RepID=A0A183LQ55_9TREM|nr:unnamed protein product [Schistosoma margrebowiei]